MKFIKICVLLAVVTFACVESTEQTILMDHAAPIIDTAYHQLVKEKLRGAPNGYVMVMAHRGDWKNHPENSLSGIERCIEMGVDFVEVDIKKTKDGHLVLMHDETLERTTNGRGKVTAFTLAELRALKLRKSNGALTDESIPTLTEAMQIAKDRIFVFIDKGYEHLNDVYTVLQQTGTLRQSVVEGVASRSQFQAKYPEIWKELNFIPRIGTGQSAAYIDSHLVNSTNRILFPSCNLALSKSQNFQNLVATDRWLLFSPLSFTKCSEDFANTWTWAIDIGMDIIVTDKPRELLEYLRKENRHL